MTDPSRKIAWKRAELAVNRFVKTSETDISRLKQFKKNIVEYENAGNRASVRTELTRAQQNIAQLTTNLDAIQRIRKEIRDDDLPKFDTRMAQIRTWVMDEINLFGDLDADFVEYFGDEFSQLLKTSLHTPKKKVKHGTQEEVRVAQTQVQKEVGIEESRLAAELTVAESQERELEQLSEDVGHAKEIMSTLNNMVHEQAAAVDSIEQNVETTHEHVKSGGLNLNKAVIAKTAGYTAIGAICGALIGGPVGLVAGAKIGALVAGTGLAVGAVAGRKLKNMQRADNEVELQNLQVSADMAETRELRQQAASPDSN